MGRLTLIARLAMRDLRYRRGEAALLLLAITAATITMTLGFALSGVTSHPYQQTRSATRGPDIVASFLNAGQPAGVTAASGLAAMRTLARQPGVTASSGPLPVSWPVVKFNGLTAGVLAEGRAETPAAIDRPELTEGSWVRPGGVVVERSFAEALGARVGERLTLNGRPFTVAGIAVSAANAPYPEANFDTYGSPFPTSELGMMWLTVPDATSLATRALPLSYLENLRLGDPAAAEGFEAAHSTGRFSVLGLSSWQDIARQDNNTVLNEQRALVFGSSLLTLLAIATVTVLVGGRMAEQTRRVGLLKAVGATPKLVAAVLLAQNLIMALAAAAAGLAVGWLAAPLLTEPGAGLVGTAGAPSLTLTGAATVTGLAVAVALLATSVPAIRAARASTVAALADSARPPRRRSGLIAISRRLPVPLLLGLRIAARRPRRLVLTAASVAVTVATIVTVLAVHAHQQQAGGGYSTLSNPRYGRVDQVLLVITIVLVLLAAVNALFITWATVLDARHAAALARALGASADQVSAGLSAALLLPALAGAIVGVPAGIWLIAGISHGGALDIPPAPALAMVVLGTLVALAALMAVPAMAGARRPPAEILQAESS
jgi:putative ABC transport system permease protein